MTYYRPPPNIQPQGFYNPWMPGPAYGQGVRGFSERMQQQQRYQQQLGQQRWERGITEREMGQRERGAEMREEELKFKRTQAEALAEYRRKQMEQEPKELELARMFVETGYIDDLGKAMAFVMKLQKPGEVLALFRAKEKIKAEERPEKAPDLWDKRMTFGRELVDKGHLSEMEFGRTMFEVQLEPSLTPASIASNRRQVFNNTEQVIRSITTGTEGDPEATVLNPEFVENLAGRAGIYLWAPIHYSQIKRAHKLNPKLVTEEELEYVKQVEYTKAYFDKYIKDKATYIQPRTRKKITICLPIENVPAKETKKMDSETLEMLYKIYDAKRKTFLGEVGEVIY